MSVNSSQHKAEVEHKRKIHFKKWIFKSYSKKWEEFDAMVS